MNGATNVLKNVVLLTEKSSRATSLVASSEVPRTLANEKVQSKKTREAPKVADSSEEGPRSVIAGYGAMGSSICTLRGVHKTHKSALENFCCSRAGEGSFLTQDALETACWRLLYPREG